ncbi:MAG: DUF4382 domain-containing protein, partial [Gammaproteobacteria bacterium]
DMGMMDMGMSMDSAMPMEYDFATPKQIDLMAQQAGNSALLLDGVSLPAGNYQWVRLKVDTSQSTITLKDGTVHTLNIPSVALNGLQLMNSFSLAGKSTANFTIDFDLRKSIMTADGGYEMAPALRLIDNRQTGTLDGSVSNTVTIGGISIADPACSPAVYIYPGSDVTPTDLNPSSTMQPIATTSMRLDNTTGDYVYKETLLVPGSYTLAMTCAADDDPATVDTLTFSTIKATAVTANQTTTVDAP